MCAKPPDQIAGQHALFVRDRREIPFGAVRIVHRNEGRLPAHRQADIVLGELRVHGMAQRLDFFPLRVTVRPGDAGRFVDAGHAHFVLQPGFAFVHRPGNRRGGRRLRGAGQRNMALAGQQPGSGVQADPARAGQIDFAPGVQVGEILFRPARAVERLLVGGELNEVAGDKTRGQSEMAEQLRQQPGGVAAGAASRGQRLFRAFARPARGESNT